MEQSASSLSRNYPRRSVQCRLGIAVGLGGADLNEYNDEGARGGKGTVVMLSQLSRIRLIRVGEEESQVIRVGLHYLVMTEG